MLQVHRWQSSPAKWWAKRGMKMLRSKDILVPDRFFEMFGVLKAVHKRPRQLQKPLRMWNK